ncbi:hypothetical protein FQR65_LT05721 [Abscondita terminalis]|nr:hypothetical protein FQR65_LT05721 [Abscondita terminalis]
MYESPFRFWLGSKLCYCVYNPSDLKIVMNNPNALQKDEVYKFMEGVVGTGLFTASVPKWKRNRRIINPTFNQIILDNYVKIFSEQSTILLDILKIENAKGEFDVCNYISRCTLDIFCETAVGTTVNAQTRNSEYVKWANRAMKITYNRIFKVWYHSDFIFNLTSQANELKEVTENMHNFTRMVVKKARENYQKKCKEQDLLTPIFDEEPQKRKSFLQLLIELSENGAMFTNEDICDEVDTFMIAGSDTTALSISFALIMLAMYQEIQEKVYQEVINVLGPDRQPNHTDLKKFDYMERVIYESLRIFPPGPMVIRAVTKDIHLEKCTLPAGTSVAMLIFGLHWDSAIYPNPFSFDPNRFSPEEIAKRHTYSWLPFSGGVRNCIGLKFALLVMKTVVANTVRKYKLSTPYKRVEDIRLKADVTLKPIDGFKISIELRD